MEFPYENLNNPALVQRHIELAAAMRQRPGLEEIPERFWIMSLLLPHPRASVVDIGPTTCVIEHVGGAELTQHYAYTAMDIQERPVPPWARLVVHDAGRPGYPFLDGSQDLVLALDVIEHIVATDVFLSEIHRVLKPDGGFLLTTPNYANLKFLFRLLRGRMFHPPVGGTPADTYAYREHVRYFTTPDLIALLESQGFFVEAEITYGFATQNAFRNCSAPLRLLIRLLYNNLPRLHRRFSHESILCLRTRPVPHTRRLHVP